MLNKIKNEIDEFTSTIKEIEGCDKMLTYLNSNIYSAIKLLMFASKTFSIYGRVLMFFLIFVAGLIMLSAIGAMILNISFLFALFLVLFVFTLAYVTHFKKVLVLSIQKSKTAMKKAQD